MTLRQQPPARISLQDEGPLDSTRGVSLALCHAAGFGGGNKIKQPVFLSDFSQEAVRLAGRWQVVSNLMPRAKRTANQSTRDVTSRRALICA